MLNSAEDEFLPGNKQQITDEYSFLAQFSCVKFSMLMNILAFSYLSAEEISCSAELSMKFFITSRPGE